MSQEFDVLVVGGGPGGATAAAILAQRGYAVALLDRATFPRYRVGESMIPYNYFPLEKAGMIPALRSSQFPQKYSVQFIGQSGRQSQPFYFDTHIDHECAQTWQVTRGLFDAMLVDQCRKVGVTVVEGMQAVELIEQNDAVVGVVARGLDRTEHRYRAKMTMDASGGHGFAMGQLGWRIYDPGLEKVAIWGYFKGAKRDEGKDEGATTITYLEGKNWLWYIPLQDDIVSVGVVGDDDYIYRESRDLQTIFETACEKNTWIREHMAGSQIDGKYRSCVHRSYRSRHCAKNGLVLLGDAFSFLDPVFSTGMFIALRTADLAAEAVDLALKAGDVSGSQFIEYGEKACREIEMLRRLVYAFYADRFSFKQIVVKYPELKDAITDCLVGHLDRDFSELCSALAEFLELPPVVEHGRAKE